MIEVPSIGDLVELNSGGPSMTVVKVGWMPDCGDSVLVTWLGDQLQPYSARLPIACVKPFVYRQRRRPISSHWPIVGEA